jgi:hypothetical protein
MDLGLVDCSFLLSWIGIGILSVLASEHCVESLVLLFIFLFASLSDSAFSGAKS